MQLVATFVLALGLTPDLELVAEPASAEVESGSALELTATFRNTGEQPLVLWVPPHVGAVAFPRWVLRRADGEEFVPGDRPFQAGWSQGLQGELLELAAGEGRAYSTRITHVLPRSPADAASRPGAVPLPAGRYTVTAEYEKEDDLVPWSERAFEVERRRHRGLWTGAVRSTASSLVVHASTKPVVRVVAPPEAVVGSRYPVKIELANESDAALDLSGALVLRAGSKARPTGVIRFVVDSTAHRVAFGEEVHDLRLEPGAVRHVELDLAAETLWADLPGGRAPIGLFDLVGGTFRLSAAFVDRSTAVVASAGGYRRRAPLEPGSVSGLKLTIEPAGHLRSEPRVTVALTNAGREPVWVPSSLTWPRHVFFAIRLESAVARGRYSVTTSGGLASELDEPARFSLLSEGLSWNGDGFEAFAPYERQSFVLLPAGGALRRTFALGELIEGENALSHGTREVRAYWRNCENGRRLGLEPTLAVGLVASEPITVRGTSW